MPATEKAFDIRVGKYGRTGVCPRCIRRYRIRKDGTIMNHVCSPAIEEGRP